MRTTPAARLAGHKQMHKNQPMQVPEMPIGGDGPFGSVGTDEVPPAGGSSPADRPGESAPGRGRFARWFNRQPKGEKQATKEKAPKQARPRGDRRESAADLMGRGWGSAGRYMQRNGHVPTGRMVTFQAPIAGEILDEAVAGTWVDKMAIQRIVAASGVLEQLYAVIGPPALTWQLEKALAKGDEATAGMLEGLLKGCIKDSLPVMIPALKKARKREADQNKQMADLLDGEDLEALGVRIVDGQPVNSEGETVDVAEVFVAMLFSNWEPPTAPPTTEAGGGLIEATARQETAS